jgi:hypothetical protein
MGGESKSFKYAETFLFYLMVVAGIIPLLAHKYFVTLDGPAHLYNGILIKSLLAGNCPAISEIFRMNPFPVPNCFSHCLFALFSTVLPGYLTEKVVIFLYLFFTPVIFRKLVLHLAPGNAIFSWFMVLFVHNQNFYFGFYNLMFGILFLFLIIFYFYKYCGEIRLKQIIILAVLFLLTYFSHLFTFFISLAAVLVISLGMVTTERTQDGMKISGIRIHVSNTVKVFLAALPALVLTLLYLFKIDSVEQGVRPELKELVEWIFNVRPLLAISYNPNWRVYTQLLFFLFVLMLLTHSVLWIWKYSRKEGNSIIFKGKIHRQALIWFGFTTAFLLLYLILPNAILLTERLILFFFLFLITWLAILHYPKWIHFLSFITVVTVHYVFTGMYYKTEGELSGDIVKLKETVSQVEEGSLLLTLNYNDNWLHVHTTGYIGCDKPMAVLENYEAGLAWFPVQWNLTHYQLGFLNEWGVENKKVLCDKYLQPEAPDIFSLKGNDNHIVPIPYILITGNLETNKDNFPPCLLKILDTSYTTLEHNNFCTLFRMNKIP